MTTFHSLSANVLKSADDNTWLVVHKYLVYAITITQKSNSLTLDTDHRTPMHPLGPLDPHLYDSRIYS